MKHTREEISAEVMAVVTLVRGVKVKTPPVTLDSQFIKDLHLSSDDATEACLMMQERTGIKPPVKEWSTVGTVGEAIELLLKYAGSLKAQG